MKSEIDRTVEREIIPEGWYEARFIRRENLFKDGVGDFVRWVFEVDYGDDIFEITGLTSTTFSLHPNCKAWNWARVIDPKLNAESKEWDDEGAEGNLCRVRVEGRESNGLLFSNVVEVGRYEERPLDI